nr:(2Fe-2S)-binding protein [Clostridium swellfunianum]
MKVVDIVKASGLELREKPHFNPYRKPLIRIKDESFYGRIDDKEPERNIICRCEKITEAEIVDALHRGIPIKSIDAVKRRVRAGMGNCQGNFCRNRVAAIIARELKIPIDEVSVRGKKASAASLRADIKLIRKCSK